MQVDSVRLIISLLAIGLQRLSCQVNDVRAEEICRIDPEYIDVFADGCMTCVDVVDVIVVVPSRTLALKEVRYDLRHPRHGKAPISFA